VSITRILTLDDIPGRSVIAQFNDVHIPYHDERALRLAVECCEDAGTTHVILNGDIHDCGVGSRHPSKKARDTIKWGTLAKSTKKGQWFFDWARSKQCYLLFGNHEKWLEDKINDDPALSAVHPIDLIALPRHGEGWEVLPSNARLRLGAFVWEHGHGIFPKGNGGQNPAARIKATVPHQVTFIGHLHRDFGVPWTLPDDRGIDKVFGAFGTGHMSRRDAHDEYAGSYPGWQQSFRLHRVYEVNNRPRLTHDAVLVHRDHRDRPVFEYGSRVYGGRVP
jgi:hypothetical protein